MQDAHKPVRLSAIVAMAKNRCIGRDNQLPWHLPADLKHFKAITTGHPILMGRKTYQSIGKPLPNRTNIILTRDPGFKAEGTMTVHSVDAALAIAAALNANELFVIGGAEIYQQLLPHIDTLYLTLVQTDVAGDAFFPELDWSLWQESAREDHEHDEKNAHDYSFVTLTRR